VARTGVTRAPPTAQRPGVHIPAGDTGAARGYRAPLVRFAIASSLFDGRDASIDIVRRILRPQGAKVIRGRSPSGPRPGGRRTAKVGCRWASRPRPA
jgi:hypothetical protein